jgi:hypothetical protein
MPYNSGIRSSFNFQGMCVLVIAVHLAVLQAEKVLYWMQE